MKEEAVPYSEIRELINVGDNIGCRSNKFFGRFIRLIKGGVNDLSHIAIIIRDTKLGVLKRVEVLEAIGKGGIQRNFLSETYEVVHGKLFWIPMNLNHKQKEQIIRLGAEILEAKIKYDYRTTWMAAFGSIFLDAEKFNCSEFAWYMLCKVGKVIRRYHKNEKEVAPVPGDLPAWANVIAIEIDMNK